MLRMGFWLRPIQLQIDRTFTAPWYSSEWGFLSAVPWVPRFWCGVFFRVIPWRIPSEAF
jgi:hypothetical protein